MWSFCGLFLYLTKNRVFYVVFLCSNLEVRDYMLYLNEGIQYGYDIQYQYKKRMYTFPANTKIYKVSIFAGGDIAPKFREAHNYVKKYGGKENEWYKVKGFCYVNDHLLEIHWVEHKKYGRFRGKIKNVLNKGSRKNKKLLSFLLSKNMFDSI